MADKKSGKASNAKDVSKFLELDPDQLPLTEKRAKFLSKMTGIDSKRLRGKKISRVHELIKWKVNPDLLLFRRICGKVVKRDPVTGDLEPVPNATVHVEDTDCNFWGYFPVGLPWVWLYPLFCTREEIAAVRTDECGKFCVFLPYWDIDRILTFQKRRICYFLFFKPRIRDLIELLPDPPIIRGPIPEPDPAPFAKVLPEAIERIRDQVDNTTIERLELALDRSLNGESQALLEESINELAFPGAIWIGIF